MNGSKDKTALIIQGGDRLEDEIVSRRMQIGENQYFIEKSGHEKEMQFQEFLGKLEEKEIAYKILGSYPEALFKYD